MNKIKRDIFLFQPASWTRRISGQVVEQVRIAIVSGCFKLGDKVASKKGPMSEFSRVTEILT